MVAMGASAYTPHVSPHLYPTDTSPTLATNPPPINTHQQDDAPEVGGPQQHVQIVGHLERGVRDEAGSSGVL